MKNISWAANVSNRHFFNFHQETKIAALEII